MIHEAGHGIYESGMPDALRRTPIGEPPSLGLHESQSRLWENWVGRGRPFLTGLLPVLREHFPKHFAAVDAEELYRSANRVHRSLIRTEADEVTYNLHVVIRFELEVLLFEDRLRLEDLPEAWNERYSTYLGLDVPDDAHGVLQDVHWPSGAFGYFPTYSLGNVIAAQLWELARDELRELDAQLEAGELEPLRSWLEGRLYALAGRFTPAETVERATGAALDVAPLLAHLERKYGELYGLRIGVYSAARTRRLRRPDLGSASRRTRSISRPKARSTASVIVSLNTASRDSAASGRRRSRASTISGQRSGGRPGLVEGLPDLLDEELDEGARDAVGVAAQPETTSRPASTGIPRAASSAPARASRGLRSSKLPFASSPTSPALMALRSSSGSWLVPTARARSSPARISGSSSPNGSWTARVKRRTSALEISPPASSRRLIASRLKPSA